MNNELNEIFAQLDSVPEEFLDNLSWDTIMDAFVVALDGPEVRSVIEDGIATLKQYAMTPEDVENEVNKIIAQIDKVAAEYSEAAASEKKKKLFGEIAEKLKEMIKPISQKYQFYDCTIKVEREDKSIPLPNFAHIWDAGADVCSAETVTLAPGETRIISTGLKVNVPRGWVLSIRPRSGLSAKTGLRMANSVGTVDTAYLDTVGIILTNTGKDPYKIVRGDRIAQFIVERKYNIKFEEVDDITIGATDNRASENGESGFGSTGR